MDNGTKQFGLPWMGVSQAYPSIEVGKIRSRDLRSG